LARQQHRRRQPCSSASDDQDGHMLGFHLHSFSMFVANRVERTLQKEFCNVNSNLGMMVPCLRGPT
jgi:hypothetical protein